MSREIVEREVRRMLAEPPWNRYSDPSYINWGQCYDFAADLGRGLRRLGIEFQFLRDDDLLQCSWLPAHGWIFACGRHFDSESPEGVVHWCDLGLYRDAAAETPSAYTLCRNDLLLARIRADENRDEHGLMREAFAQLSADELHVYVIENYVNPAQEEAKKCANRSPETSSSAGGTGTETAG